MRRLAWLVLAVFVAAPALAGEVGDVFYFDAGDPPPDAVMAATDCDGAGDGGITRRPFAGGFVFAVRCPGNNANYTIVKFVGIRIMYVKLTGKPADKKVIIQPAPFVDNCVIPGDLPVTQDSIFAPSSIIN